MAAFRERFVDLLEQDVDEQAKFFINRFAFSLGDQFFEVLGLRDEFKEALEADDSSKNNSLSAAGAAGFLQQHGKTRTVAQRKAELADIDLNQDGMIALIEYLMLHYKIMILGEHFERKNMEPDVDMENDGVGLTGVGDILVEELFSPPAGLDPELQQVMEDFQIEHAKREQKINKLLAAVDGGGVRGMAAKNELEILQQEDQTAMHAVEARIAAAIKKANKAAQQEAVRKADEKAAAEDDKRKAGQSKIAATAALFGGKK